MKQLLTTTLIAIALLSSSFGSKNAHAGFLIGAIAGDASSGVILGSHIGGGLGVVAGILYPEIDGAEPAYMILTIPMGFIAGTLGGVVLDIDASLPNDQLASVFKSSFPFIDNEETWSALTQSTKAKFRAKVEAEPESTQVLVQFSRSEIAELLSSTDLTESQFEQVAQALE